MNPLSNLGAAISKGLAARETQAKPVSPFSTDADRTINQQTPSERTIVNSGQPFLTQPAPSEVLGGRQNSEPANPALLIGSFTADANFMLLSAGVPPSGVPTPEAARSDNTEQVFDEDYYDSFLDREFEGSGSAELNSLLEEVLLDDGTDPDALNANLDRLAEITGNDDPVEFRKQYEYYLELAAERDKNGGQGSIDLDRHPDHLGTLESLRSGAVIGDSLGIDPVFGALLSPTGGLVGPGDDAFAAGPNDAIGVHSAFHDAGGYLLNRHGVGPGYDYLGREPWAETTEGTVTGQVTGIEYWVTNHPELDVDLRGVEAIAESFTDNPQAIRAVEEIAGILHRGGFEEIAGQLLLGVGTVRRGVDATEKTIDGVEQITDGDIIDGARTILEAREDFIEARNDFAFGTADNVKDSAGKVAENVKDTAEKTVETGRAVAEKTVETGRAAAEKTVESGRNAAEKTAETAAGLIDSINPFG